VTGIFLKMPKYKRPTIATAVGAASQ